MEIESTLKTLLAERLGVTEDQVLPTASLEKDLGADSLDAADLLIALNALYKIHLSREDMQAVETVAELAMLVHHKQNRK